VTLFDHLILVPVVLPMLAAIVLVLIEDRAPALKPYVATFATLGLVAAAIGLLLQTSGDAAPVARTYLLGDWPAPIAIVLVADRLSALMVLVTAILGLATFTFAQARWERAGVYFHVLFQFQLMGLCGAFLTGDLFNLFVFFEVMLAASYGLALHGSGVPRVRAGLHYVAVNLFASSLFLVGVSLIYGTTGTLNMADLATRIPLLAEANVGLFSAGAAVLGVAFLVKAGMWPMGFWLPTTYAAATPPVAALFAIMSKVGVYVVLRLTLMLFGPDAGAMAGFGATWLIVGGMATMGFGIVGVLAAQEMTRMAGYIVLISSGTLLALVGIGGEQVISGLLFYMVSSTFAVGAFFLLIELVGRGRAAGADILAITLEAFGDDEEDDMESEPEVGAAIPATVAWLGACFIGCTMLLAGMPPFSGFLAKFAIVDGIFGSRDSASIAVPGFDWAFIALLMLSGLAVLVAMIRYGVNTFWVSFDDEIPRVRVTEMVPVLLLLGMCLGLTLAAGPVVDFLGDTARSLDHPARLIDTILHAPRVAGGGTP
jgi:multicomponent K+:H+ antiporter subunit D